MNLVICEKKNVLKLLQFSTYDAIISINDPYVGSARKWESHKKTKWASKIAKYIPNDKSLILYFWDSVIVEPNGPSLDIIRQIIEFSKSLDKNCNLLIHCKMGVSRSPAAGMIVLAEHGMNINDAYEYILTRRLIAIPNSLMLELYKENFNRK